MCPPPLPISLTHALLLPCLISVVQHVPGPGPGPQPRSKSLTRSTVAGGGGIGGSEGPAEGSGSGVVPATPGRSSKPVPATPASSRKEVDHSGSGSAGSGAGSQAIPAHNTPPSHLVFRVYDLNSDGSHTLIGDVVYSLRLPHIHDSITKLEDAEITLPLKVCADTRMRMSPPSTWCLCARQLCITLALALSVLECGSYPPLSAAPSPCLPILSLIFYAPPARPNLGAAHFAWSAHVPFVLPSAGLLIWKCVQHACGGEAMPAGPLPLRGLSRRGVCGDTRARAAHTHCSQNT